MNKKNLKNNKTKIILLICSIIVGFICVTFTHYDAFLYKSSIGEVIKVTHSKTVEVQDEYNNTDYKTKQQLLVKVLNGKYKNKNLYINNTYTYSGALDVPYYTHQQVLMSISRVNNKLTGNINGPKRDTIVVFTIWLAISLTLLFLCKSGILALLSIVINGILFYFAICWDLKLNGVNVLSIFCGLAILFAIMTLFMVLGFNKSFLIAFSATIGGTFLAILIGSAVMFITHDKGMYFESMAYVTQLPRPLFHAEALLGSLGAVMDIIMDMVATLTQVCKERPDLTHKQVFITARNIGHNIMGPLVNVLFLIFIGCTLPMAILYLRNDNSIAYTFKFVMSLGIVESLISGVGIALAVLLTEILSAWIMGRSEKGVNN